MIDNDRVCGVVAEGQQNKETRVPSMCTAQTHIVLNLCPPPSQWTSAHIGGALLSSYYSSYQRD